MTREQSRKPITPRWFKPAHQPDSNSPVEFLLRPASLPVLMDLRAGSRNGMPNGVTTRDTLLACVVGWRGGEFASTPFSRSALEDVIDGAATSDWIGWSIEIIGSLVSNLRPEDAPAGGDGSFPEGGPGAVTLSAGNAPISA
jgi:hypothetical protein